MLAYLPAGEYLALGGTREPLPYPLAPFTPNAILGLGGENPAQVTFDAKRDTSSHGREPRPTASIERHQYSTRPSRSVVP
jgi:hypothetical protein